MKPKIHWLEMFPAEFVEIRDRHPVCWMAYGLAEPHGPYNALGLDWLKAQTLVERAAETYGGIVAPPCAWHIQERLNFHDDGQGRGWLCDAGVREPLCSSIPADLFFRLALHQVRAMDARGFHAAVLVTGHYGGVEVLLRRLCEFYIRCTGSPLRIAALADWECIAADIPYRGDHAGLCETSQLMVLRPGLTDLTRRAVPETLGTRYAGSVQFDKGPLPSEALGRRIVESQIAGLGKLSAELLAAYTPRPGWKAPHQDAVDEIWRRFEALARPYWDISYSEYKAGRRWGDMPPLEAAGG